MKLINNAIEKCGYKMSTKRVLDLVPGLIEIIDTGSTGRGTNEPGDGDFDFMVRLDKILADIDLGLESNYFVILKPER